MGCCLPGRRTLHPTAAYPHSSGNHESGIVQRTMRVHGGQAETDNAEATREAEGEESRLSGAACLGIETGSSLSFWQTIVTVGRTGGHVVPSLQTLRSADDGSSISCSSAMGWKGMFSRLFRPSPHRRAASLGVTVFGRPFRQPLMLSFSSRSVLVFGYCGQTTTPCSLST